MVAAAHSASLSGSHGLFVRNDDGTDIPLSLTAGRVQALELVSLCISLISICMTFVAYYWFLRMRRSFRHDLIMLLIRGDIFKALWFMIFPIVDFLHGPVQSSSAFCQASGFFLAVGLEATDFAVLLIAVHTALYIFRPKQPNGKNGLYPYRRWAFGAYLSFPILMASLAFLHSSTPYANVGGYCYLPLKPSWPRAGLSWIPRFIIILLMFFVYIFIYCYVSCLMRRFSRQGPTTGQSPKFGAQQPQGSDLPIAPRPVYQGSTAPSRRHSYDVRDRRNSTSSLMSIDMELDQAQYEAPPYGPERGEKSQRQWKWMDVFSPESPSSGHHHDPSASQTNLCDANPVHPRPSAPAQGQFSQEGTATQSRDGHAFPLSRPSLEPANTSHSIFQFCIPRADDRRPSYCSTTSSAASLGDDTAPMADARHKVRQQLRLLFIYPVVYTIMWIPPFISHVKTWPDGKDEVPYPVVVLALASVCLQGAANSILFSIWEKPWRHVRGENVSSFKVGKGGAMVGRTREEMMVDGRIARVRLGAELEERKRREREKRESRHWWDLFDAEGAEAGDNEGLLTR